ncbi:MAG: hypothetical protein GX458_01430 [Phyllobacteriaceae bacterium]|nr:hypothetical protein [Phyllobacteriaceae bacterium]
MRATFVLAIALGLIAGPALAKSGGGSARGQYYVRSYTTHSGVYVPGHYNTTPNGTRLDNWSTVGNVNPHTGKPGDKPMWKPLQPIR